MRVIIADDSAFMRRIVMRTLRQAGYDDCDVTEGRRRRRTGGSWSAPTNPTWLLSDWNMPNMTGINALIMLRAEGCNVPSGSSPLKARRRCREQSGGGRLPLSWSPNRSRPKPCKRRWRPSSSQSRPLIPQPAQGPRVSCNYPLNKTIKTCSRHCLGAMSRSDPSAERMSPIDCGRPA